MRKIIILLSAFIFTLFHNGYCIDLGITGGKLTKTTGFNYGLSAVSGLFVPTVKLEIEYFKKCLMGDDLISIKPSERWSDDAWYLNQKKRVLKNNPGFFTINNGEAEGTILGGNLCTLNLLQGTKYFPDLKDTILFIEDDSISTPQTFDRDLHSLTQQPGFNDVKALVIGRFQKKSKMTNKLLKQIIKTKKILNNVPIIVGADFGHTDPKFTFPIGGKAKMSATKNPSIEIMVH